MYKARYTNKPEPVLRELQGGYVKITIAVNPCMTSQEDGTTWWEADTNEFWEKADRIDLDAVRERPAAYLDYATVASKRAARRQVQAWNDTLFATTARLECPALGWAIEYTPKAVTLASAIASAASLGLCDSISWTDADDVRHDALTVDDFKLIAAAIKGHVDSLQTRADAAREAIRTANTNADIQAALQALKD